MVEWIEKQRNMQMSRWNEYDKFDKMILNQQIRFTYKSLKRYIIEKHVKYLKHWDLTSTVVLRDAIQEPETFTKENKAYYDMVKGETESLKFFMKQVDNETAVNILFACSKNEFSKIMDKFSLRKREIIEKCYNLLADNMREYNFMDQYSRPYDNYSQATYNDNSRNRYDDSRNRFSYSRGGYNDYSKRNSNNYYNDKYSYHNYDNEKPVYSGRFKDMFKDAPAQEPKENKTTEINDAISIIEKPRSPQTSEVKRSTYKSESSGFYTRSRDRSEKRSRYHSRSDNRHSHRDYKDYKDSRDYKDYRRSSHRSSRHRRSSSRRSSSRSHHRHRRY